MGRVEGYELTEVLVFVRGAYHARSMVTSALSTGRLPLAPIADTWTDLCICA